MALGLPLLFVNGSWGKPTYIVYALTYSFFVILMNGEYPPTGTRWFWRSIPLIVLLHFAIVAGLIAALLEIPGAEGLPRILFGFLTIVVFFEWRAALWILDTVRPNNE